MTIVVMKFGGSCLVDDKAFTKIKNITTLYQDNKLIYVASAFNGITDLLLDTADKLHDQEALKQNLSVIEEKHVNVINQIFPVDSIEGEESKKWIKTKLEELKEAFSDIQEFGLEPYYVDYVSSFGEILSTFVLNQYLRSVGFDSLYIPANKIIITNDNFNNAYPYYELTNNRIRKKLIPLLETDAKDFICCVTGFIGRNKIGYITTLGRGGSDYTATILARSLHEVGEDKDIKVILWKDVDGLLAIDPKYVPNSSLIRHVDYAEAKEIANFGAKVLHPKCLEALEKNKIPLEIRNFNNPREKTNFTIISEMTDKNVIKGISAVEDATIITLTSGSMVNVPGVLGKIFRIMGKNGINVSLVSQSASEISTSFVVAPDDTEDAIKALKSSKKFESFFDVKAKKAAMINITGAKILDNETRALLFSALARKNVPVRALSQSYDELNLSLVIDKENLIDAIKIINDDLCSDLEGVSCENKQD